MSTSSRPKGPDEARERSTLAAHRLPSPAATAGLLEAIEELDFCRAESELETLMEAAQRLVHGSTTLGALYLYDVLRQAACRLSVTRAEVPFARRAGWMAALASQETAADMLGAFRESAEEILAHSCGQRRRINPIVVNARRFIEEHHAEQISLSRVAEEIGVARNYLSSLFRRECNQTLTDYIHSVRIDRARSLLRSSSISLAEAASRVGYRNYRHFYRSFLKVCGVAPTAYLRRTESGAAGSRGLSTSPPPLASGGDVSR